MKKILKIMIFVAREFENNLEKCIIIGISWLSLLKKLFVDNLTILKVCEKKVPKYQNLFYYKLVLSH